jgi:hypothetical protein
MRTGTLKNSFCGVLVAVLASGAANAGGLPVTGVAVPELSWVDDLMLDYLDDNGIRSAVLGIMKDGCVVYQRGFGWHDAAQTVAMPENSLFRIASCTKPITAAAIQRLAAEGDLALGDNVFNLGQAGGGILTVNPFGGIGDADFDDITVQQCLVHTAGWDRGLSGDHTYRECQIASDMGVASPPGRVNTMNWILGQPLNWTPGMQTNYSNEGYLALGLVVEQASGMAYIDYVRSHILTPNMWVPWTDVRVGRTFPENQSVREVEYDSTSTAVCVFPRSGHAACDDNVVERAYGGYDHEARVGQGAMVVSAATMLRVLETYRVQVYNANIGAPLNGTPVNGSHNGGFSGAGVNTFMRQRSDGASYFVFFNHDDPNGNHGNNFDALLNPQIAAQVDWPADCVDGFWVHPSQALPGVYGSFDRPYADLTEALPQLGDGSRVNIKAGNSDWTGTIDKKLTLRAPQGTARIGM